MQSMSPTTSPTASMQRAARSTVAAVLAVVLACLVGGCGPLAAGDPATASTGGSSAAGSSLVGTWVSTVTRDDLRAAGITADGLLDENSGRFTWTFAADGTWTQRQEAVDGAAINAPVFEGTYELEGSTFVQRTTFPAQYAGDRLVFEWRLDGDELSLDLTNPDDPILPAVMEAHPWTRVDP
jgi:hypothetical protein